MQTTFTVTTWVSEDRGTTSHQYQLTPQGSFPAIEEANSFSLATANELAGYKADSNYPYTAFTVVERWEEQEDGELEFAESMDDYGHLFASGTWEDGVLTIDKTVV